MAEPAGAPALDLDAYCERLGVAPPLPPTRETLERLHVAHLGAIPFSNLDVRLRRPVPLDLPSLVDRLVHRRRGGYCFEQNTLFAAVLRSLGFEVETLEARVSVPDGSPRPRTHMCVRVRLADADLLVDVGFGGDGPLLPVPLDGSVLTEPVSGDRYRVAVLSDGESDVRVLQRRSAERWVDLYSFTLVPALAVDYEVAHHFTSTHPRSVFVTGLTAQRSTLERRQALRGVVYTERQGEVSTMRKVDLAEAGRLLRDVIGLAVGDDEVEAALPRPTPEPPGPPKP